MKYICNIYIIQSQDHKVLLSSSKKKKKKERKGLVKCMVWKKIQELNVEHFMVVPNSRSKNCFIFTQIPLFNVQKYRIRR